MRLRQRDRSRRHILAMGGLPFRFPSCRFAGVFTAPVASKCSSHESIHVCRRVRAAPHRRVSCIATRRHALRDPGVALAVSCGATRAYRTNRLTVGSSVRRALCRARRRTDRVPGAVGFPEPPETDVGPPDLFAQIRARHFDLAIQLHGSGGIANDMAGQIGAAAQAGFVQPDGVARPGCFIGWLNDLPEVKRYLALMEALGVPTCERPLAFPLNEQNRGRICRSRRNTWRRAEAPRAGSSGRTVAVAPLAGGTLRCRRRQSRHRRLADRHHRNGRRGAAQSAVLGAMASPALHLAGATSLGGLAALVSHGGS